MRSPNASEIVAIAKGAATLFKVVKDKGGGVFGSVTIAHGNLEYSAGKVTVDEAGNGIYCFKSVEAALAGAPTAVGSLVVIKVIPIGDKSTANGFDTYSKVVTVEAVATVNSGVNVGDVLYAPKHKKFFQLRAINADGTVKTGRFASTAVAALTASATKTLNSIGNCAKVPMPLKASWLDGLVHDGTTWKVKG